MAMKVDLHTHTTCSDGHTPPRELIRLAKRTGLDVIAVTDHDSVEALPECIDEGKAQGVRVIPGIEVSSRFEGHDVHVLGFGLDHASASLQKRLGELHESRRMRVGKICEKLAGLGLALDPADVLREAGGKSVGRRHVARAMVKKGHVGSIPEAFDRYLGQNSPANVPAHEMTPGDAARLILDHGGVPSFAHPGFLDDDVLVERILDATPIRALEVFHRYRSATKFRRYLDIARRRNLRVTGGSDFHGDDHPKNGALGSFTTPPSFWKELENSLRPL